MIRNEEEYREAIQRFKQDREAVDLQRKELTESGELTPEQVEYAMQPMLSFQAQLTEEITWYENVLRRHFSPAKRLTEVGRLLVALRIASGLTQAELAKRLEVNRSQVCRDERNEYHGITLERAQVIIDALQASLSTEVNLPLRNTEPIGPGGGGGTADIAEQNRECVLAA